MIQINTKDGSLIFFIKKAFSETLAVEDELFSSFLTAFNSLSDEFFSKGLDRIKIGEYTML